MSLQKNLSLIAITLAMLGCQMPAEHIQKTKSPQLTGFASLPANTFSEGPSSGHNIEGKNGFKPPFSSQPVQGFSAAIKNKDGTYTVMPDNGFGTQENSRDFLLRMYTLKVQFLTKNQSQQNIDILKTIQLKDPNRLIPFEITHQNTTERLLTGADFDPESMQQLKDGSYWIGDEFGPYLLHFSADGTLLDPPISLPDPLNPNSVLRSPQNQFNRYPSQYIEPLVQRSAGFEGMALSPDQMFLYPILEKPLLNSKDKQLIIFQFDVQKKQYTPNHYYFALNDKATNIGDFQMFNAKDGLIIERDATQNDINGYKKLIQIHLNAPQQLVTRHELVNLMQINNPHHLYPNQDVNDLGTKHQFMMPFETIEDIIIESPNTITVFNDNNFPFSSGRNPYKADNNEIIQIKLTHALK
ncbi:esterase-like activity of phytase family protein [Acinetobacter baretiae]|uniref:esterase-like activity of phytase family protein n=1 Tax=Acinetobacter baretiae TaxID=2605383 RepID=UPI0038B2D999